jgi:hypothetical protein
VYTDGEFNDLATMYCSGQKAQTDFHWARAEGDISADGNTRDSAACCIATRWNIDCHEWQPARTGIECLDEVEERVGGRTAQPNAQETIDDEVYVGQ